MIYDPRPYIALGAAVFGVWAGCGAPLGEAASAAVLWPMVAWLAFLSLETMVDDRDAGFLDHLMTPISNLGMAVMALGRTLPPLLNGVYAVPERFRGWRMPYHGLFDADWWNAGWVWPAAGGLGLALIVLDVFVRGPLRFVVFAPILHLAHAVARRW